MSLKDRLHSDLTTALKAKEEPRRTVLRSLLTALRNAEIVAGGELDEPGVTAVVQKQLKQRRESVAAYAGRPELAAAEEAEATIIAGYLPEALTPKELSSLVGQALAATGATSAGEMGQVMGWLKPRLGGRADGAVVAAEVKTRLG